MVNSPVLVLNQTYEPLDLCRVRRAVMLIFCGKAEALENGRGVLHSATEIFEIPSVIRLVYMVRRPRHQRRLNKVEVFNRDKHTCQYCGRQVKELTLDHVIPRRLGGEHSWENVVSACKACNLRKGGTYTTGGRHETAASSGTASQRWFSTSLIARWACVMSGENIYSSKAAPA